MSRAPLLTAANVSKAYGPVQALDGVVLTVDAGEIVALCGENGSGKSTLSKVVSGAVSPDSGEVLVDGDPTPLGSPQDGLAAGIALVAQELTAVPGMSIAENVLLPSFDRPWMRVRRQRLVERSRPFLRTVGLGHIDPLAPFASLGPGDRELVEVAKALATGPRVLILDEVTARLPDPERLFELVERLAADGLGVVFITHRLREIRRLAHRAVVLRDGHLVGEVPRDDLTDERLSSMMVGRALSELYAKPDTTAGDDMLLVDGVVTDRSPHPITLHVRAGEVVGLGGLVGSGRSELLETIALARRPRAGRVLVGGEPVTGHSPRDAGRAGIALLPEDRHTQGLVLGSSIERNIAMARPKVFARTDRLAERRTAAEAVDELAIRAPDTAAPVATLSGGNQQKVVFARCLAAEPRVLLLDEPTRGVDIGAREEIYRIIADAVEAGMAVLMVSSDMVELLGLSDRIVVLHEGAVAGELGRDEATEEAVMRLAAAVDAA